MAGKYTRLQKTYRIDGTNVNPATGVNEVPMYRGVIQTGESTMKLPTADNEVPLGVVDNDERLADPLRGGGAVSQAGKQMAVKLEGIAEIELAGTIAAGDRVIFATGGFAKKMPTAAGTYNVIGYAEKAGVDGDVIPVRMVILSVTVS